MRLSVIIPPDLEESLESMRRSEGRSTSEIVRDALDLYARASRRRGAGEALLDAAVASKLDPRLDRAHVDAVLSDLERDRGRSDRL